MTKFSNSIVIGGPIMSGKTTIINELSKTYYCETSQNDELQDILLAQSFEGDEVASPVYAFDKMLVRFDKYKEFCNNKNITFFSSSILEDHFFAYLFFNNRKNTWNYYDSIWKNKMEEMVNELGLPKIYFQLSINWENFKYRLKKENNKNKLTFFNKNKKYFKKLINKYDKYMMNLYKKYNISYFILNTNNKSKKKVIQELIKELKNV